MKLRLGRQCVRHVWRLPRWARLAHVNDVRAAGGRDSLPALQRVITLVSLLADSPNGVGADALVAAAGYGGAVDGQREQLARDIRHLVRNGWRIENIATPGSTATYRLQPGDPRIRLAFDPEAQAAFERAAQLAGISLTRARESAHADDRVVKRSSQLNAAYVLELILHAQEHRCVVHFAYRDSPRVVRPDAVWVDNDRWYVRGRQSDGESRNFRLDRMTEVTLDAPGSAGPIAQTETGINPLHFADGEQVVAQVSVHPEYRRRTEHALGQAVEVNRQGGQEIILDIPVVSHQTFLRRLCELGTRVQLVGPESLREELRDMLRPHCGGKS